MDSNGIAYDTIRSFLDGLTASRRLEEWMGDAACAGMDPNTFFPSQKEDPPGVAQEKTEMALDCCSRCTVKQECLDFAIRTNTKYGIFGGMLPRERDAYAANS